MASMFELIKKRDGDVVKFDPSKITTAIFMAGKASGEFKEREARKLMLQVLTLAHEVCGPVPEVEEIQDIVERVLLDSPFHKAAKAYILYREQHTQIRNIAISANIDLVEQYIRKLDWKIKENSNMCYSLQGLNNYIASDVTGEYWLNRIYPPEIRNAHKAGDIHIHDLSQLSVYTYFGKEVIVAKYHGDVLTLSFEQLYEMAEAKEELLNEKDNAWAKYPKALFVMDKDGWTRVTRLVRKAKDKPMRFLKNRGGRSVIVTEDHPMITERGETAARDVQIKEDRLFTVDMVNCLIEERLFSQERIDLVQEIRSKGFYGREGDVVCFNGLPVSECADESDGIVHTLSFCAPRYIRLTGEFGFFVGLALAEGYLTYDSKSYVISMNSRNRKDLERANTGLLQHGWSGVITHRKHDNMYEMRIRNRFLRFLFANVFQIRPGSRHKTLPVGILSYSQDFLRGIAAGVLDGDGAANGKTGMQLRMASRTLLEQLAVALPFIGLFPRDRNCEGVGTVREYAGRTVTQNFPIYGLGFRKMDSVVLPSEKYSVPEPSQKAWQDETVDAWHKVLNNAETDIPDEYIYDITTETNTLVVNGMWNHNCVGWDLNDLLLQGFRGVAGKVESAPPRHLRTALGQLVNFIYTLQGESAGAQAVSDFDTLLAPFVRYDGLNYKEVKQAMQEFVFNSNIPTRVGFQCMSADTEILTPEGWMGYEDIEVGQTIKTFNVKTGDMENLPVKKVFSRHYEGEMYNLKNRIQDQLISPGHRVVRKVFNTDDSFVLEEIEKILEYKSPVILPITGKNCNSPKNISDEEIRVLAWIIAEGTKENSTKHRHCHRITIYQSRTASPENYEEIIALLDKCGSEYSVRDSTPALGGSSCMIRLNAASSQKILDDLFKTRNTIKFIPDVLKNMDRQQARVFLDTYLRADGFEGCKITTTDIDILNGLQQIAVDAEYGFTVMTREPTIGKKMLYVLRLVDHQGTSIMEIKKVDYSGIIWCPNTDNETVVARRNGKVFITGNTPFFNITMDLEVPSTLKDHPVIIGGEYQSETYAEYQAEMNIINEAFAEVMMEGDATGRVFTFPIPTYNITKDFDWDNPNLDKLWVMTGKFGTPYFSNFVNSDMSPDDTRSMCCRLRLDNRELIKRGGGLFGAHPLTGSIGVATINLPRIGYVSKTEADFFGHLRKMLVLAKDSLMIKRKILEDFTEKNLYPYSKFYLREVKNAAGLYWNNHFSTFGIIGMNEACLNFIGKDIGTEEGQKFSVRVMDFIRDMIAETQEETGDLFNLEATPAEGTSYRLAMLDKEKFPEIICANENDCCNGEVPYYTNSSQLPVNYTDDIFEMLNLQDELQTKYTGGCIEKGNKVVTDKGAMKIEEIASHFKSLSPIKALSYNPKTGQSEWDLITDAVTINVAKHHKIKVVAERGIEITTSDWHPFFVMEKISFDNQCPVCAKPLKNVKAFAAHLRHSQTCREKYVRLARYEVVEKRADELRKGDYILQNSQNLLPEKSSLDSDSAYLIGFFIGDGSISEFKDNRGGNNLIRYKTRFFSESRPVLDKISDILNRLFGCQVKPIRNDKRSEKLLEVSTSKKAVSDFLFQYRFFAGKKAYTISIPSEVKRLLSKENFYGFLAGLIDSDGHVDKKRGTIEYYTVSEKLADDIVEMSSIAGVLVAKHRKTSQRDNEADVYRVFISGYQATLAREDLPLQRGKGYVKEVPSDRLKRRLPVVRVLNTSKLVPASEQEIEVADNDFYDLTTEKNHNYLAGNNSFVFVHNTVLHVYLGEMVSDTDTVKALIRKITGNFRLPYFTLTPTFSVCPSHGYLNGEQEKCPTCGAETEIYSRVVGYLRPVNQWNKGKRAEFGNRKIFRLDNEVKN